MIRIYSTIWELMIFLWVALACIHAESGSLSDWTWPWPVIHAYAVEWHMGAGMGGDF